MERRVQIISNWTLTQGVISPSHVRFLNLKKNSQSRKKKTHFSIGNYGPLFHCSQREREREKERTENYEKSLMIFFSLSQIQHQKQVQSSGAHTHPDLTSIHARSRTNYTGGLGGGGYFISYREATPAQLSSARLYVGISIDH